MGTAHAYSRHQVPDVNVTWDSLATGVRQKSMSVNQILVSMETALIWSTSSHVSALKDTEARYAKVGNCGFSLEFSDLYVKIIHY